MVVTIWIYLLTTRGKIMRLLLSFSILCVTMTGCGNTPASPAPPPVAPADTCDFICVQYLSGGDWYCDSDCDGWYDAVEIEFGDDPCNPYSPPFSPSSPATVCEDFLDADVIFIFNKAQQSDPAEIYESQRNDLAESHVAD